MFYVRWNFPSQVRTDFIFHIDADPLRDNYEYEIWFQNIHSLEEKVRVFKTLLCNVANNLLDLSADPSYLDIFTIYNRFFFQFTLLFQCLFFIGKQWVLFLFFLYSNYLRNSALVSVEFKEREGYEPHD